MTVIGERRAVPGAAKGLSYGMASILALAVGMAMAAPSAAAPQAGPPTAEASGTIAFDIPAQDLNAALLTFADRAGLQLVYDVGIVRGLRNAALQGRFTARQGLDRLLAGTGLTFRFSGGDTVTLQQNMAQQGDGPMRLGPVRVQGRTQAPYAPVDGYVAERSATGSKTNTPIIETPQSISVVTRDQIEARAAQNIGEAVQYSAGLRANVQSESSGLAGSNIVIRGFGGDGTSGTSGNEYVDGLRISGTNFAAAGFEPYLFERVEVLKGPSSVLYGQSTPAGIVNHVSKRPTEERFLEIQGEVGSFERFEGAFDLGGAVDDDKRFLVRLTGLILDTESQTDFTGRNRKVIAPALTWRPSNDTTLTLLATYQDDDFDGGFVNRVPARGTILPNPDGVIAEDFFQGDPNFNTWDRQLLAIGYQFEHRFDETWTVRQNARYVHNDLLLEAIFGTVRDDDLRTLDRTAFGADEQSDDFTIDNQLEVQVATGPASHTLLFGVDYQNFSRSTFRLIGSVAPLDLFEPVYGVDIPPLATFQDIDNDDEQIGIYLQDQIKLGGWILTLGGRYDWSDSETTNNLADVSAEQSDDAFTGRAALSYVFENGLAPYVGYSESFLPVSGTDFAGDAFKPTTGNQYEAGIKYEPANLNALITLAAFQIKQQNVPTADPDNPGFDIQTGEIRSRGIELEALASLTEGLNLTAAYTYLDVEITESNDGVEGNRPDGAARHLASFWGDYTIQAGDFAGLGAAAGVRYVGPSPVDDQNSAEAPGYTLVDAAVHYDLGQLVPSLGDSQIAVNISNVLDNRFVVSCARIDRCFQGVGRNVIATLRLRW